jgi:hypothetical protein
VVTENKRNNIYELCTSLRIVAVAVASDVLDAIVGGVLGIAVVGALDSVRVCACVCVCVASHIPLSTVQDTHELCLQGVPLLLSHVPPRFIGHPPHLVEHSVDLCKFLINYE